MFNQQQYPNYAGADPYNQSPSVVYLPNPQTVNQNMYGNAYGNNLGGNPVQVVQPMNYEQMMAYRQQLMVQRQEYQMKQLREKYPVKYALIHGAILILLSCAMIALQIVVIINKAGLYYIGSGIWVAGYLIICASTALLLIKYRNQCLFVLMTMLHAFGMMISFGGLIAINAINLSNSSFSCRYSCSKSTNNSQYDAYYGALLGLGVISAVACISYLIAVTCILNMRGYSRQVQQNPNPNTNPVNYYNNPGPTSLVQLQN